MIDKDVIEKAIREAPTLGTAASRSERTTDLYLILALIELRESLDYSTDRVIDAIRG